MQQNVMTINLKKKKRLKKCPLKTSTEYEKNRTYLSLK